MATEIVYRAFIVDSEEKEVMELIKGSRTVYQSCRQTLETAVGVICTRLSATVENFKTKDIGSSVKIELQIRREQNAPQNHQVFEERQELPSVPE